VPTPVRGKIVLYRGNERIAVDNAGARTLRGELALITETSWLTSGRPRSISSG
jgi:hypothetical protein